MYSIPNLSNTKPNTKRIEPARTSNLTLTIRRSVTLLTTQKNIVSPNPLAFFLKKKSTLFNQKKDSPHLPKPLASIPHPATRARRPIAARLPLRRIPRLHRFRHGSGLVRGVPRERRRDGAVQDVAGDCGVESGCPVSSY